MVPRAGRLRAPQALVGAHQVSCRDAGKVERVTRSAAFVGRGPDRTRQFVLEAARISKPLMTTAQAHKVFVRSNGRHDTKLASN
jgi:hypothetical protein